MSNMFGVKGAEPTQRMFRPVLLFFAMAWKAGLNLTRHFIKPEEEAVLLRQVNTGGLAADRAKELIIKRCQPLVDGIAQLFSREGLEHEDAVQEGNIGLLEAIKKYDLRSGIRFSLFALAEIGGKIARAISFQREEIGYDQSAELGAMDTDRDAFFSRFAHFDFLNEKEKKVLEFIFGLGMSPREAGEILGLSGSEASRLKRVALDKIRAAVVVSDQTGYQKVAAMEQIRIFFNSTERGLPN